jgi:hypothetical protein
MLSNGLTIRGRSLSKSMCAAIFACGVVGCINSVATPDVLICRRIEFVHPTGGQEDLHAFRLAMYARRNSCESMNAVLKGTHKLGLDGADRTRTANESVVELLISLALLSRTAFVVANERAQHGLMDADPPAALLAALATPTIIAPKPRPKRQQLAA